MKKLFSFLAINILLMSFAFGQKNKYYHDRQDTVYFAVADTVGHGSNNYFATNTDADFNVSQYLNGFSVTLFFKKGITGSPTLTLITKAGTLTKKKIRKSGGQALVSGDIPDSTSLNLTYYNGNFRINGVLGWIMTPTSTSFTGTVSVTGRVSATGVIRDSAGSVAIPAYSSISYPTNGMYFPSSVQLGFSVSGGLVGGWNTSGLYTGNITEQTTGAGIVFAKQTFQLRTATTFTVSHTIGADSLIKGGITIASGTCTITLPTGTALTTATGATTNYGFDVDLNNVASGGILTIAVNTGIVAASALTGGTTLTLSPSATAGYGRIHFQAISANNWVISRTI